MTAFNTDEEVTEIDTIAYGRRELVISVTESSKGRSVRLEAQVKEDFSGWRTTGRFYIRDRELAKAIAALSSAQDFLDG